MVITGALHILWRCSLEHFFIPELSSIYSTVCFSKCLLLELTFYAPFSGIASHRVGSDLRTLYCIGELDDYELLKKEVNESVILLNSMEARIKDRLRAFTKSSPSQVKRCFIT